MHKLELLAPAGNFEKAKIAIAYGADALYLAGKRFGMRASAGNFSEGQLAEVIKYAHQNNVKIYVTVNIFPHNDDLVDLPEYINDLASMGADALIIADVGVYRIAQKAAPNLPIHISTQANTVNYQAALFWQELGVERLVMGREITKEDIKLISSKSKCEIEVFVHGSMCMAYSGRCLISHIMTGRDANRGQCTQSCRWKYAVVEEMRPGDYYPISEELDGTYLFNSKDLCLLEYIPDLIDAKVTSFKIEGRMKSIYYVGTVVRAYRQAIDSYYADPVNYQLDPLLLEEVQKVSHRPYYPGFFLGREAGIEKSGSGYTQTHEFLGLVQQYEVEQGQALIQVRNQFNVGDEVEVMQPQAENINVTIRDIIKVDSEEKLTTANPNQFVLVPMPQVKPLSMIRIKKGE